MPHFAGEFLAIGIDPSKQAHQFVAVRYPDQVIWSKRVSNHPDAIHQADLHLQALAKELGVPAVYATEDAEHYGQALAQLLVAAGREVRTVNPLQVRRQKDFYGEDKSDAVDARAVAAVLIRQRSRLPEVEPGESMRHALRALSRYHGNLTQQHRRACQQLHDCLTAGYLSAYRDFFSQLDGPLAVGFFKRFPLPHDLVEQTPETLASFLLKTSGGRMGPGNPKDLACRKAEKILKVSIPLARQPVTAALQVAAFMAQQLCSDLMRLRSQLSAAEKELDVLLDQIGDPLRSLAGVGTIIAATVHGEVLSILRFDKKSAFAKYNGTAPAERQSGNRRRHVARRRCNRRLKRALWLAALSAVRCNPKARAYFDRRVAEGMKPKEAIKRVARHVSDVIYGILNQWEGQIANTEIKTTTVTLNNQMGEGARPGLPGRPVPRGEGGASPRPHPNLSYTTPCGVEETAS